MHQKGFTFIVIPMILGAITLLGIGYVVYDKNKPEETGEARVGFFESMFPKISEVTPTPTVFNEESIVPSINIQSPTQIPLVTKMVSPIPTIKPITSLDQLFKLPDLPSDTVYYKNFLFPSLATRVEYPTNWPTTIRYSGSSYVPLGFKNITYDTEKDVSEILGNESYASLGIKIKYAYGTLYRYKGEISILINDSKNLFTNLGWVSYPTAKPEDPDGIVIAGGRDLFQDENDTSIDGQGLVYYKPSEKAGETDVVLIVTSKTIIK